MSGKIFGLAIAAAMVIMAPQAEARRLFWWEAQPRYDRNYDYIDPADPSVDPYSDPQDADVQDMFNQEQYDLYVREMQRKHQLNYGRDRYDPALYDQGSAIDPQSDTMQPRVKKPAKPKKPKVITAAKPGTSATDPVKSATIAPVVTAPAGTATNQAPAGGQAASQTPDPAPVNPAPAKAPVATASAAPANPVAETPKTVKGGKVTCAKGEEIVASYGFLDISQKTCEGSSLVYSAVRGKSNFEVEVNPANGEVTAVRKLS